MIRRLIIVAAIAWLAPAGAAPHDDRDSEALLAAANDAFLALHYEQALHLVEQAWHRGDNDPAQLRRLFALAGQAAGSIEDTEAARLWFSRLLCVDPDAALPEGTSPKLTALLGAARDALAGAKITATATPHAHAIDVAVTADPLAIVTAARYRHTLEPLDHGHAAIEAKPVDDVQVELIDRYGNVLAMIPVTAPAPSPSLGTRPPPPPGEGHPPGLFGRWTTWAAGAAGLAVVGGGALWVAVDARSSIRSLNANSGQHEYAEAEALQTRFDAAQWTSRIAFGGAAVAVVVGIVLYARGAPVAPAPRADTPVAWSVRF